MLVGLPPGDGDWYGYCRWRGRSGIGAQAWYRYRASEPDMRSRGQRAIEDQLVEPAQDQSLAQGPRADLHAGKLEHFQCGLSDERPRKDLRRPCIRDAREVEPVLDGHR